MPENALKKTISTTDPEKNQPIAVITYVKRPNARNHFLPNLSPRRPTKGEIASCVTVKAGYANHLAISLPPISPTKIGIIGVAAPSPMVAIIMANPTIRNPRESID